MKHRVAVALLCAVLSCSQAEGEPLPGAIRMRYTLRLEELVELRHRLLLDLPGLRLVFLEERAGLECTERSLGVAAPPFAAAGPLVLTGLWRKIHNPLAHGPGSQAHEESTGLRLDGSFSGCSRRGVVLSLRPEAETGLSGGATVSQCPGTPLQAGGWVDLRAPEGGRLTGLAAISRPPRDQSEQSWILDRAPYPGGGLVHLAGSVLAGCARVSIVGAGSLSGGPLVAPGAFGDCLVRLRGPTVVVSLLGGACTPEYRRPNGVQNDRAAIAAARLEIRVPGAGSSATWTFDGEAGATLDRPRGDRAEAEVWVSAALAADREYRDGAIWRFRLEGQGLGPGPAQGPAENRGRFALSVRADRPRCCLEGEVSYRRISRDERTVCTAIRARRRGAVGEGSLRIETALGRPQGSFGFALRGEISRERRSAYLELHTRRDLLLWPSVDNPSAPAGKPGGQLGLTLGWEARVP